MRKKFTRCLGRESSLQSASLGCDVGDETSVGDVSVRVKGLSTCALSRPAIEGFLTPSEEALNRRAAKRRDQRKGISPAKSPPPFLSIGQNVSAPWRGTPGLSPF